MIEQAAREWQDLCAAFAHYTTRLDRNNTVHVNSATLRDETKRVAQIYFRGVRNSLQQFQLDELIEPLSVAFEALLVLSQGRNLASSYKKHTRAIRKLTPRVTSQLEVQGGAAGPATSSSETDEKAKSVSETEEQKKPEPTVSTNDDVTRTDDDVIEEEITEEEYEIAPMEKDRPVVTPDRHTDSTATEEKQEETIDVNVSKLPEDTTEQTVPTAKPIEEKETTRTDDTTEEEETTTTTVEEKTSPAPTRPTEETTTEIETFEKEKVRR